MKVISFLDFLIIKIVNKTSSLLSSSGGLLLNIGLPKNLRFETITRRWFGARSLLGQQAYSTVRLTSLVGNDALRN